MTQENSAEVTGISAKGATETATSALPVYTIEGLLRKAGIFVQTRVFAKIESIVRVKGIATKIKPYSNSSFVTLVDRDFSISVKIDSQTPILENDPVIVEGVLFIKPSNFITGLECYIDGHVIGAWQRSADNRDLPLPALSKTRYLRLDEFFAEHDLHELLILGTETAITDVCSQLARTLTHDVRSRTVVVAKKASLMEELRSIDSSEISGVVITRGGDDSTMRIWDDAEVVAALLALELPFYVALGHTHRVTLTDQYADGSFHTPSSLGNAINSAIIRRDRIHVLTDEHQRLMKVNAQLKQQLETLSAQRQTSTRSTKAWWILLLAALAALLFAFRR